MGLLSAAYFDASGKQKGYSFLTVAGAVSPIKKWIRFEKQWMQALNDVHAHTAYRDPKLASLSQEELAALDALTRKLALPSPDTPHNQIESNTAVEAIEVESGAIETYEMRQNDEV
jgi:hypothetical protein